MDTTEITNLLLSAIPYPQHIRNINQRESEVRFEWRDQKFCVSDRLSVDSVGDGVLIGDAASILLQAILRQAKALSDLKHAAALQPEPAKP